MGHQITDATARPFLHSIQLADLGGNLLLLTLAIGRLGRANHACLCRSRFNARRVAPSFH